MICVILIFQAYASRTLACEQALCLGKGRKNGEKRFFSPFPQTESLFTGYSGGHFLDAFIMFVSPHTNTRQETRQ